MGPPLLGVWAGGGVTLSIFHIKVSNTNHTCAAPPLSLSLHGGVFNALICSNLRQLANLVAEKIKAESPYQLYQDECGLRKLNLVSCLPF